MTVSAVKSARPEMPVRAYWIPSPTYQFCALPNFCYDTCKRVTITSWIYSLCLAWTVAPFCTYQTEPYRNVSGRIIACSVAKLLLLRINTESCNYTRMQRRRLCSSSRNVTLHSPWFDNALNVDNKIHSQENRAPQCVFIVASIRTCRTMSPLSSNPPVFEFAL